MELPNDILNSPQAAQLMKDKDRIMKLMESADAHKLMDLLQKSGGSQLKGAADAAMQGNPAQLMEMVQNLMRSPEGAKTVENIQQKMKK